MASISGTSAIGPFGTLKDRDRLSGALAVRELRGCEALAGSELWALWLLTLARGG